MKMLVPLSGRVYRLLTYLYPPEIRRRWQAEMTETFVLELADAVRRQGWRGVAGVWCRALAEVFRIALPLQFARDDVAIPFAATAGAGLVFYALIWTLENSLVLGALYHRLF